MRESHIPHARCKKPESLSAIPHKSTLYAAAAAIALIVAPHVSAGKAPKIGVDKIPGAGNFGIALASPCTDSTGTPWAAIGLTRPAYVNQCAERRLRLLPALPGMEQGIAADVSGFFANKGPGMTVGLVLDDGLYYSQGFGFADLAKTRVPDESTIYRPGSISKVITATGLLALIDDSNGTMKLSDNADTYLSELKSVCPAGAKPEKGSIVGSCPAGASHLGIKLFHLTSHTSGLGDVLGNDMPWLAKFAKTSLLLAPGTYSSYSGVSLEAAGVLEARVAQSPSYAEYIRTHLFVPLGMTHSTMDPALLPGNLHPLQAQLWNLNWAPGGSYATWSLAPFSEDLQHEVKETAPAGGLTTSVWDFSRFMRMWISGSAPSYHGHALISAGALQNAITPSVADATMPPSPCGDFTDAAGDYFSPCRPANVMGVGWVVNSAPWIWHNGKFNNWSGSWNEFQGTDRMGATAMVATDPFPDPTPLVPTPGFDVGFAYTVAHTHLLAPGVTADAQTSWSGTLPSGVARLLWLSGVEPPLSIDHPINEPRTKPGIGEHPNVVPGTNVMPVPRGGQRSLSDAPETRARFGEVFGVGGGPGSGNNSNQPNNNVPQPVPTGPALMLAQFAPAYRNANNLTATNINGFVFNLFGGAGGEHNCSTFRVRRVMSSTKIALRLLCTTRSGNHPVSLDATLTVNSGGFITALDDVSATGEDY